MQIETGDRVSAKWASYITVSHQHVRPKSYQICFTCYITNNNHYITNACSKINIGLHPLFSCLLKFGAWAYNESQLNISLTKFSMDLEFSTFLHGEWLVLSCPCVAIREEYHGGVWPVVMCHVNIKRRPLFYVFNLGVPIVLLLGIGSLSFCLPPDSGDKISLSVTVFLTITVFIMVVMENLPSTSQAVPLLGKYPANKLGTFHPHFWLCHS